MKAVVTYLAMAMAVSTPARAQNMSWPAPERTVVRGSGDIAITRVGGYPQIDVRANGRTYRFALETGAAFIMVSPKLAQDLGLQVQTQEAAAPQTPRATTRVDSIQIGNATMYNVTAAVTDMLTSRGWDGLISPPLLRDLLYTLDLRNNRLRLEQGALPTPDGRTILPISKKDRGGRIDFPLVLGNVTVDPVIDTQSLYDVIIADSLETSVSLTASPTSIGQASGPSQGTFTLRGARLTNEARVGATAIAAMPVIFRNRPGPVAGIAFLEGFVITVDAKNGRVRFTPHETPVRFQIASWETPGDRARTVQQSGSTGRFMLGLRSTGTPSTVVSVDPGSNIDRAGIKIGDVFLEVDGIQLDRVTPADWARLLANGTPIKLTFSRNGVRYTTEVTPIPRPAQPQR